MPTTAVTKKRGRPAKKAAFDENKDLSTAHGIQADEESATTKKGRISKAQKQPGAAAVSAAPAVQGDGLGTTEAAPSAVPTTAVKKRRKRKSIGQQSMSRAKSAKGPSPLKPGHQPRRRIAKPDLAEAAEVAEATDLEKSSAKGMPKESFVDPEPLNKAEPAHFPEVTRLLDSGIDNVEPRAEKLQHGIAQKHNKRKRATVEELPKKRVKPSSTQSKRAPKAPKPHKEYPTEDALDTVQSIEQPVEVEADSLNDTNEKQETASGPAKPRKEKAKKRKRVIVGQQPKKPAKGGITRTYRQLEAQQETSAAGDVLEEPQSVGKPAEVEVGSTGHVAEEQDSTAGNPKTQTQKPKRKKRKSIGQQKPKRKSVDFATPNRIARKTAASSQMATSDESSRKPTAKRGRPRAKKPLEETIEGPQAQNLGRVLEEEEDTQSLEPGLKSKPKARRVRPKAKPVSEDAVDRSDEEAWIQAHDQEEEAHVPVLPEKKKRGRPRKVDSQSFEGTKAPASRKPKAKPASKARAPPKNTIPITIYAPPSPTSSDAEDDPLSTSQPHTTSNTINPVDVLAQLCSELLAKSSSALAEQARSDPSSTKRSELKRTKQTTDLYAEELASRLLQLTTTLNTNTSLQSRVKAAAKEERKLKKELKQLEKEREDLRIRREEAIKERKKRDLEELLSGIAGAVKRGWDMQKEDVEGDAVAGLVEDVDLGV